MYLSVGMYINICVCAHTYVCLFVLVCYENNFFCHFVFFALHATSFINSFSHPFVRSIFISLLDNVIIPAVVVVVIFVAFPMRFLIRMRRCGFVQTLAARSLMSSLL